MEFVHGNSAEYGRDTVFTRAQLLAVKPNDIKRFMGLLAYDDPDYIIEPPASHRPIHCRSSNLEGYKKAISHYMPHRTVPWVNNQGNPTRSTPVNDIINEVKKFEVRGEGCPPNAKRPLRENEFRKSQELLKAQPNWECKYRYPMVGIWQHNLIGRLDDAANFQVKDPRGHGNFDFAIKTKVRWSKNVMEERRCPDQVCPLLVLYVFLLFSSPPFPTF